MSHFLIRHLSISLRWHLLLKRRLNEKVKSRLKNNQSEEKRPLDSLLVCQ